MIAAALCAPLAVPHAASANHACKTNGVSRPTGRFNPETGSDERGEPIYNVHASGISCKAAGAGVLSVLDPDTKRLCAGCKVYEGIIAGMDEWPVHRIVVVRDPLNPGDPQHLTPLQHWKCRGRRVAAGVNPGVGTFYKLIVTCHRGRATVSGEIGSY